MCTGELEEMELAAAAAAASAADRTAKRTISNIHEIYVWVCGYCVVNAQ